MDEARVVLARLDRIEALEREGAPPGVLLEELRGLVQAAEAWARLEGDARAEAAVERCRAAISPEEAALDTRGCVMISTADTILTDPATGAALPTSRPLFVHQNAGLLLTDD